MLKQLVLMAAIFSAVPAFAQTTVPQQLAYEGRLTDLNGNPSAGSQNIQFAIWPSLTGGVTPLWTDTVPVTVINGLYSVTLGTSSGDPLPPTLFDGTLRYLAITVNGDVLSPRQPMGSVPYSFLSGGVQGGLVNASSYAFNGNALVSDAGHPIVALTNGATTVSKTINGLFCGASNARNGAISDTPSSTTGYRATKVICQSVCGSPTAHMCSGQELVSSIELGMPAMFSSITGGGSLWFTLGAGVSYGTSGTTDDCAGWTSMASGYYTADFLVTGPNPTFSTTECDATWAIACCD